MADQVSAAVDFRGSGRMLGWAAFFAMILGGWALCWQMVRGDGSWVCGPGQIAALPLAGFGALLAMWTAMTAAMMLPTVLPFLSSYQKLPRAAGAGQAGWFGFIGGYALIWVGAAAGFAALQSAVLATGTETLTAFLASPWYAAALLTVAGMWQFSRPKIFCQSGCLAPVTYFAGRFRPGASGGVVMGTEIGLICIGCCWALMALAMAGGMNSLVWMGLATAFMVAEKLPEIGMRLRRPAGMAMLAAACWIAAQAAGLR